jgi:histidinol-phosphatase (PHP family)
MIMRMTDYHVHADFSPDSRIKLSELLPYAASMGFTEIAITEHLDLLPQEFDKFGTPSLLDYKEHIKNYQSMFPHIKLYCGIEVGDFQQVRQKAQSILNDMKFDIVLGSVHFVDNVINVAVPMPIPLSKRQVTEYYEQNLLLVETCDIDVLAHLGVYKRYYVTPPDESYCLPIISKILETIINRGIALEINYSAMRRSYKYLHPETEQLELYKKLGGKLITLGSDSHQTKQIGDYYQIAKQEADKFGFIHLTID